MNELCFDLQQYIFGYLKCHERVLYKKISKQWHFVLSLHSPGVKCEPLFPATLMNVYNICFDDSLSGFAAIELPDGVVFWQSYSKCFFDDDEPLLCYTKYVDGKRVRHTHGYTEYCLDNSSLFQSGHQCVLLSVAKKVKVTLGRKWKIVSTKEWSQPHKVGESVRRGRNATA